MGDDLARSGSRSGWKNFPDRSIFLEIVPFKKIKFEHFNPHFITTILFLSNRSDTQIEWTLLFETIEMREIIVKAHRPDEGQVQNMERLEKHLSGLNDKFV